MNKNIKNKICEYIIFKPKTEDELNEINEFIQRKKQNMEDGKQVNVELISDEPIKA